MIRQREVSISFSLLRLLWYKKTTVPDTVVFTVVLKIVPCIFRRIRTVNPRLFGHYSGIIRTVIYVPDTPCRRLNRIRRTGAESRKWCWGMISLPLKRTTVPDTVVFLTPWSFVVFRKVHCSLRIILIFFSSYGLYRTSKSNLVLLFTMLLWWEKVSKPALPWYRPMPLSPTPPKGR